MFAIVATMSISIIMPDAQADKATPKVHALSGNETRDIVCGDRLCSQSATDDTTNSSALTPIDIDQIQESSATSETKHYPQPTTQQSIVLSFNSQVDGSINISIPSELGATSLVIVDGEEWDDVLITDNQLSIDYFAGTETIEIIVE